MMTGNGSVEPAPHDDDLLYLDKHMAVRACGDGAVRLIGEIDVTNGDAVADALYKEWTRPGTGIADVAQLRFIDLHGLRALAMLADMPLGRPIRLRNANPALRKLLTTLDWPGFTIG